ncbi:MAG: hypothetical protein COW65_07820 [Cytophagales bacterium CG18_big_fil_WC_8_21_14_2_50_42_9]|nr:MAG: hypothetical protein COW65_07820 [Cytophagales bacterium CG18_big_fil_WC_8_21_14_2_50_42_9]
MLNNKKKVIMVCLVVWLYALCLSSFAQTGITPNALQLDQIAILKTGEKNSESAFNPLGTPSGLIKALGKPLSITKEYAEIDDIYLIVYKYNGAEFDFNRNSLVGFHITNGNFIVRTQTPRLTNKTDTFNFRVGDPASRVQKIYPQSFKANRDGRIFFRLYSLTKNPNTNISTRTNLDASFLFVIEDGVLTGIIFGE